VVFFSNDDQLWNTLNKAGYATGDRVWRLPLYKHYTEAMKCSDLADLNNISAPSVKAGSCTAAAFLKEFVQPNTKWLHLDIAGVMQSKKALPYMTCSMSGRPMRTLVHFLKDLAEDSEKGDLFSN